MKQLFLTLMVSAFSIATVFAQDAKKENPNAPKFKFKSGEVHDFGNIPEGPNAEYTFEFTNVGKEPLIIQNASASCGCTTPEWPKQPILPGKSGKIKVSYATQGRPNQFTKDVYILSNAVPSPGEERYVLKIKGNVTPATKDDAKPAAH